MPPPPRRGGHYEAWYDVLSGTVKYRWVPDPAPPAPPSKSGTRKTGSKKGSGVGSGKSSGKAGAGAPPPAASPSGGAPSQSGPSAAEIAAAEAARQRAARQARIAARQARIVERARKRGERIAKQIDAKVAKIEAAQQQNQKVIKTIEEQISRAKAAGASNATLRGLYQQRDNLFKQWVSAERQKGDAARLVTRKKSNDQLRLDVTGKGAGEKLSNDERRRLKVARREERASAVRNSNIPQLAKARYSPRKAGDAGRARELQAAIKAVSDYQLTNPDDFDDQTLVWLGDELSKHDVAVATRYNDVVEEVDEISRALKAERRAIRSGKKKDTRKYNQLVRRGQAALEGLREDGTLREARLLYGKSKSNIKGSKVRYKGGVINDFKQRVNAVYNRVEERQNELIFGSGIIGAIRGNIAEAKAGAYLTMAERSRRTVYNPLTGKAEKQSTQARLTEMLSESGLSQEEANAIGQRNLIDYTQKAAAFRDDPVLHHLFDRLLEHNITNNQQLGGDTFDEEFLESRILPDAVRDAYDEWSSRPDFSFPEVDMGLYDPQRYGRDAEGVYFVLNDNTIVRPGDPLPDGHPQPRWDLDSEPDLGTEVSRGILTGLGILTFGATAALAQSVDFDNSYSRAQAMYEEHYLSDKRQAIEDSMRAEIGLLDPGFLGDAFRQNAVGELVSSLDAIPGGAALAIQSAVDGQALLNFDGAVPDLIGQAEKTLGDVIFEVDRVMEAHTDLDLGDIEQPPEMVSVSGETAHRLAFIEQHPELFENHEVLVVGRASDTIRADPDDNEILRAFAPKEVKDFMRATRPIVEAMAGIGFDAAIAVAFDSETGDTMVSMLYQAPIYGAVEVGIRKSPAISEDIERRVGEARQALESGDLLVTARVLGTNEIVQIGNGAGLTNFLWYLFMDPTNFIPGVTLGKKGLAGVRAAIAAGRDVPPGVRRLSSLVHGFSTGFRADAKVVEGLARMESDIRNLAPDLTPEQQARGLQSVLAGVDETKGIKDATSDLARELERVFGRGRVDTKQLEQIAEGMIHEALTNKQWIVRSQVEDLMHASERAKEMSQRLVREQQSIDDALTARNVDAVASLEREGTRARRAAASVRRADEALESEALGIVKRLDLEEIERRAVAATDPRTRRLYERARTLGRERRGGTLESGGAIAERPSGSKPQGIEAKLREAEAAEAQRARRPVGRQTQVERDASRRAVEAEQARKAREARAQRLESRKRAREEELREREAADFGRSNEASTRLKSVTSRDATTRTRAVPEEWGKSNGPRFWRESIHRGIQQQHRNARDLIADVVQTVEGLAIRHGRWTPDVNARRVFYEQVLSRRVTSGFLSAAEGRNLFRMLQRMGSTQFGSYEDFVAAVGRRGRAVWQEQFGDELYLAYEQAVATGRIIPSSSYEATFIFVTRQQFNTAASADEAITYLKNMERFGDENAAFALVEDMFGNEINTWNQRIIQSAFDLSDTRFSDLMQSPVRRLNDYLNDVVNPVDTAFVEGAYRLRPEGPIVGFTGRTTSEALQTLENAARTAGGLTEGTARAVDGLVTHLLYDALGAEDFRLAGEVLQSLATSGNRTKAGRLARLIRERMHKELDILGIEAVPSNTSDNIEFTSGIIGKSGRFVGGQNRAGRILLDRGVIAQKFADKTFTHPRPLADGSVARALSADTFKTYQEFEQFVIRHERVHSVVKRLPKESLGDYESRVNDIALDPRQYSLRHLPTDYPSQPTVVQRATEQAKALMNRMGQSEQVWLETRIKRNRARINNKSTDALERSRLLSETQTLQRAIEDIRVRRAGGYEPPATKYGDAAKAAEALRDDLHDILPPGSFAVYAETPAQARVEVGRSIYVSLRETPVEGDALIRPIEKALDWFPMARYQELNDAVSAAIRKVQATRTGKVGLKKLPTDKKVPGLKALSDEDGAVARAKIDAISAWTQANNLPRLPVAVYDEMRLMLSYHIQKGVRAEGILDEIRRTGGSVEDFVPLRSALADEDAVETIKWMLVRNPGMTPEEAFRQFSLAYAKDGFLRRPRRSINLSQQRILREFFEQTTGASVDNQDSVRRALTAEGTRPNFEKQFEYRNHMEKTGQWSPRKATEVDASRPPWSLDDEREFFMTHYGEAPVWTTDPRIVSGEFLNNRSNYYHTMVDVGTYNDEARVARQLAEEKPDIQLTFDERAYGGDILKPKIDRDAERLWLVQRWGDIAGTVDAKTGDVFLRNAPWLMDESELRIFMQNNSGADIGHIIKTSEELGEVRRAMGSLVDKYTDMWVAAANVADPDLMIVPSSVVHRISFDVVREMAITTPWKRWYQRLTVHNVLHLWSSLWVSTIVSFPAFTISNFVDVISKAGWFRASNRFAVRPSRKWKELIPSPDSIGIKGTAFYNYDNSSRGFLERIRGETTYGNVDRAGAVVNEALFGLSRRVLPKVEMTSKGKLAQSIATGIDEDIGSVLRGLRQPDPSTARALDILQPGWRQAVPMDDRVVDLLVMLETRRTVSKLFPSLEDAGQAERILNKVFPFISYNFKNKVLWMSEVVDHPWVIPVIQSLQGGLIDWNQKEWAERHPGIPMPENLTHEIRIPGTDIFLDIGMFTDAARGAGPLIGVEANHNIGQMISNFIRPLPSQQALVASTLWNLFGIGGRYKWTKVIGEDGFWTGEYERILVPPGTPWGDRPLDILRDLVWPVNVAQVLQEQLKDGKLEYAEVIRIIGSFINFGQLDEPSRYYMLNQTYFLLAETSDEAAREWLLSEDGKELQEMWVQHYWNPTATKLDPFAFPFRGEDGEVKGDIPDPDEIRKRWLGLQPPETRDLFLDAWAELRWGDEYWDEQIDSAADQDYAELYRLRETWFTAFYHEHPYLWRYAAMGMAPQEFADFQARFLIDRKRGAFFDTFGLEHAPTNPKKLALWQKEREAYLRANPDIFDSIRAEADSFDAAINRRNELWKNSIRLSESLDRIQQAVYETQSTKDDRFLRDARKLVGGAFEIEAFGFDKEAEKFRVRADSLTSKIRRAGGDKEAIAAAAYAQRMQAVAKKAGNDPLAWHKILDRNKDLRDLYWQRNPEKRTTWERDGQVLEFWGRFNRLADKGKWDQAWDAWDELPAHIRDHIRAQNPQTFRKMEQSSRYSAYMQKWVSLFDTAGHDAAMRYFNSLPDWVKERYYDNHPGRSFGMTSGRGAAYVTMLNRMFDQIDADDWDAAERIWKSAPAWMRRRYYADNPDSKLFRGGSGGSGGGISDAKYKQYSRMMGKWVDLLRDGKDKQAANYFRSLPQWAQDFYLARHPDKQLMKEDDQMLFLLEQYLTANRAAQQAMLQNNPRLARWLTENDTQAAWQNAVTFIYTQLPDDPWLKRVYREKYPEIFSKEARGRQKRRDVAQTLAQHPEFADDWERWLKDIYGTLAEALKYSLARPKSPEVDHSYQRQAAGHTGRSAEEVAKDVREYPERQRRLNKRLPKLDA